MVESMAVGLPLVLTVMVNGTSGVCSNVDELIPEVESDLARLTQISRGDQEVVSLTN